MPYLLKLVGATGFEPATLCSQIRIGQIIHHHLPALLYFGCPRNVLLCPAVFCHVWTVVDSYTTNFRRFDAAIVADAVSGLM